MTTTASLTPGQRAILRKVDPISGRVFHEPGQRPVYQSAVRAGLLTHVHGITYAVTPLGLRMIEKL